MALAHGKIARALYRGLWRAGAKLEGLPSNEVAAVTAFGVTRLTPTAAGHQSESETALGVTATSGDPSLRSVLRHSFRAHMNSQPGRDTDGLIATAFMALRTANQVIGAASPKGRLQQLQQTETAAAGEAAAASVAAVGQVLKAAATPSSGTKPQQRTRPARRPSTVHYSIGQVIRHRIYGYRAVIVGWTAGCEASNDWVERTGTQALPHGTAQPFYHCLVDVRDRPQAQVSYVAQDNVEMLTGRSLVTETGEASNNSHQDDRRFIANEGGDVGVRRHRAATAAAAADFQSADPLARLIIHPLITKHFREYRPSGGYYVPNESLQDKFPWDTPAAVPPTAAEESTSSVESLEHAMASPSFALAADDDHSRTGSGAGRIAGTH